MLKEFAIRNYRAFKSLSLNGLSDVNVFVGKNNAGKTSLLEAFYLFSRRGSAEVFTQIASKRGELITDVGTDSFMPDVSHFFCGHVLKNKGAFELIGDGLSQIAELRLPEFSYPRRFYTMDGSRMQRDVPAYELRISRRMDRRSKGVHKVLAVNAEGGMWDPMPHRMMAGRRSKDEGIGFIAPDLLDYQLLVKMWNRIVTVGREADIVAALKLLLPDVNSVQFLLTELSNYRFAPKSSAGIVVGLDNFAKRVPLGSLGDGMRRLLAIAMSLLCADGGCLFIDEIDAGFHYSVMCDLWRLVIEMAKTRGIQVFVSTHSLDCLRGLSCLCCEDGACAKTVALYALHEADKPVTRYSGPEISMAIDHEIEVRS